MKKTIKDIVYEPAEGTIKNKVTATLVLGNLGHYKGKLKMQNKRLINFRPIFLLFIVLITSIFTFVHINTNSFYLFLIIPHPHHCYQISF